MTARGGQGPDAPSRDDDPGESLAVVLAKVDHLLARRIDVALVERGLTARQYFVLAEAGRTPGVSSTELGHRLLISRQATNVLIHRLVAAGLIAGAPSAPRQPRHLTLTAAGHEVMREAVPAVAEVENASLAALAPPEIDVVRLMLGRLLEHLTNHRGPHS